MPYTPRPMPEVQQVKRLILSQFQQFRLCDFDFTDPVSGRPLARVCLTGPNGCGKSTILAQLYHSVDPEMLPVAVDEEREANALTLTQYQLGDQSVYLARNGHALSVAGSKFTWFSSDIENAPGWVEFLEKGMGFHEFDDQFSSYAVNQDDSLSAPDVATAWMSPPMDLIDSQPADDLREMVDTLSRHRTELFNRFLKDPDHREETIAAVEQRFEDEHPDPLAEIAESWKPVLAPAGIRFSRSQPVGLISGRSGESIPFSSLSAGLQRYLLRTGHLRLLAKAHPHDRSFFVIDEPENGLTDSLATSLLADSLGQLRGRDAQVFVATLSETIAATFAEHEVFELEFDESNGIKIKREELEITPPPEKLKPLKETVSLETKPNAVRLARLKREIKETDDQDELADLIDELMSIRER